MSKDKMNRRGAEDAEIAQRQIIGHHFSSDGLALPQQSHSDTVSMMPTFRVVFGIYPNP